MVQPVIVTLPHTITVIHAELTRSDDGYNTVTRDWELATSTKVAAYVQPVTTAEALAYGDRDQVTTRYKVFTEADTAVSSGDRIEWDGLLLSVDGEPQRWSDPFGTADHIQFLAVISIG